MRRICQKHIRKKRVGLRQRKVQPGLVAFTTSGQETGRVYSFNPGNYTGTGSWNPHGATRHDERKAYLFVCLFGV